MRSAPAVRTVARSMMLAWAVALLVVALPTMTAMTAQAGSEDAIARGMEMRAEYGLPASAALVHDLIGSAADVGSDRLGIPMTKAEWDAVDYDGRVRFSDGVHREVEPWLENQVGFAGMRFDQQNNGRLVVYAASHAEAIADGISSRLPEGERGFKVVTVEHTLDELLAARDNAPRISQAVDPSGELVGWGTDLAANKVRLVYTPGTVERMRDQKAVLASALDVPVKIDSGSAVGDSDTSDLCNRGDGTREKCWEPLMPGVAIGAGSYTVPGGTPWCTLAWHVHNDDAVKKNQVLTAGHCVHNNTRVYHSSSFHDGSKLGDREATRYTASGNVDVARIGMEFASEGSEPWIFGHGSGHILKNWTGVADSDSVRMSGAASKKINYGTVTDQWFCWHSGTADINVCGAEVEANSSDNWANSGDSGSPIYLAWQNASGTWVRTPVGVQSGATLWPNGTVKGDVWYIAKLKSVFESDGPWSGWDIRGTVD